jgi:hypothetical protein
MLTSTLSPPTLRLKSYMGKKLVTTCIFSEVASGADDNVEYATAETAMIIRIAVTAKTLFLAFMFLYEVVIN